MSGRLGIHFNRVCIATSVLGFSAVAAWADAAAGGGDAAAPGRTHGDTCEICKAKERLNKAADWLSIGADLRLRSYLEENIRLDHSHAMTTHRFWQRPRPRLWFDVTPHQDVTIRTRFLYESRYWCKPDRPEQYTHNEGVIDQLYVKWRNVLGQPLAITVGRQDLKFGNGWLIKDGTPLDGGRSFFFDAIRATAVAKSIDTTFDLVFIQQYSDSAKYIRPFNDRDVHLVEHDETGAIFYVSNKSLADTTVDGYFIYKHNDAVLASGDDADIYTFGGRVAQRINPKWDYRAELAGQFGQKEGENICALGANSRLVYTYGGDWKTKFHFDYEYRGGSGRPDGGFDILWGRHTQWSNLYNYYISQLDGLMAMSSNLHRFGPGVSCKPAGRLALGLSYHALFRDHNDDTNANAARDNQAFRGHMVTGVCKYKINEHVTFRVLWDLFMPGGYYSDGRNDVANFIQTQLHFIW